MKIWKGLGERKIGGGNIGGKACGLGGEETDRAGYRIPGHIEPHNSFRRHGCILPLPGVLEPLR